MQRKFFLKNFWLRELTPSTLSSNISAIAENLMLIIHYRLETAQFIFNCKVYRWLNTLSHFINLNWYWACSKWESFWKLSQHRHLSQIYYTGYTKKRPYNDSVSLLRAFTVPLHCRMYLTEIKGPDHTVQMHSSSHIFSTKMFCLLLHRNICCRYYF